MRLFEVDSGIARDILSILRGQANKPGVTGEGIPLTISLEEFKDLIRNTDLSGLVSTPDGLRALTISNPNPMMAQSFKDVISNIDDSGTITLNTTAKDPNAPQEPSPNARGGGGGGPDINSMASHNSKNFAK
jgi:hypothetical protein